MSREKMVYFRTSLGGFKKEDVNNYIEKLNSEYAEREKASKKKLEDAEARYNDFENVTAQLNEALSKIAELETDAQSRENLIAEQISQMEDLNARIEGLKVSKNAAESQTLRLHEQLNSLSEAIQKSEKYDGVSSQIGEIILSAKTTAEDIVNTANREAVETKAQTNEQLTAAAASFNARAATAAYTIRNQLKIMARESYGSIAEKAEQTAAILGELQKQINAATAILDEQLTNGKSDAEAIAEKEAAKIFTEENRIKI